MPATSAPAAREARLGRPTGTRTARQPDGPSPTRYFSHARAVRGMLGWLAAAQSATRAASTARRRRSRASVRRAPQARRGSPARVAHQGRDRTEERRALCRSVRQNGRRSCARRARERRALRRGIERAQLPRKALPDTARLSRGFVGPQAK
eukprot:9258903-Pyramimonas_sp.AAC.2